MPNKKAKLAKADLRKIILVFVIAVLYLVFVLALSNAIFVKPEYSDYCNDKAMMMFAAKAEQNCSIKIPNLQEKIDNCSSEGGNIRYIYDDSGCPKELKCDYCSKEFRIALESFRFKNFLVGSFLGLLAIISALFLPVAKNELHRWSSSGFILGGLLAIFTTTAQYYSFLHRTLRPVIIFFELALVLFVFYRQFSSESTKKRSQKPG